MAYVGDDRWRTDVKVRVNCKYYPTSSKIVLSSTMRDFRRTTLVKSTEERSWTHLQDRASAKDVTDTKNMPKMVLFLPEPRKTRGVVAHLGQQRVFDPEVDIDLDSTMNNRQRQIVNSGVLELNGHDDAIRLCFNLHTSSDVDRQTPCVCFLTAKLGSARR